MKKILLLMSLMLCVVFTGLAQAKVKITGNVKDEKGEPLMGVQIVPVGATASGGLTDLDGNFSIMIPSTVKQLSFSYIGYAKHFVAVAGQQNFKIVLKEEASALEEVVVTGYTTQQRTRMTTSIAKVDSKALASVSRSNAASALAGSVPGLTVVQATGQPGSTPSIALRGGLSFNGAGASPLIIVDGVVSSFYGLNSDDIETMEVLKDAASTAIYGARAANGVILVTTKRGKMGRSSINFRSKFSFNRRPQDPMQYLGAKDYIRMNRLAIQATHGIHKKNSFAQMLTGQNGAATGNTSLKSVYTTQYLNDTNKHLLTYPGWQQMEDPLDPTKTIIFQENDMSDLIYQPSGAQDYSLSFDGGNDKGTYYLGLGYLRDRGFVMNSGFKRYSFSFNGSYNVTPKLKVSSSVMYILSDREEPWESVYELFQRVQGMAPTTRLYYANQDGSDSNRPFPGTYKGFGNPHYYADKVQSTGLNQQLSGNVQLDYKITPKLTASLRGSYRTVGSDGESFTKAYQNGISAALNTTRISSYTRSLSTINQVTALLNYRNTFAKKHNITGVLGSEYYHAHGFSASASTRNAPTDLIPTMNAGAESAGTPSSSKTEYAIASVLGQFNYDYDMRYLVGLTFRYDGTTRLMQDKWGFFPGVSFGWNVHNEQFYKNSKIKKYINSLKPRLSYGVNGNIDALGNYDVQGLYARTSAYNSDRGYVNTRLLNPTLRWERSTTLNFGLDAGFLGNRVTLMADYFIRNVIDKISGQDLPLWTGFSSISTNNGVLQNRGLELQINANLIQTKDFDWSLGFNFTRIRSYAKQLPHNGVDKNRQGGVEIYDEASKSNVYVGGLQEGERLGWDLILGYQHDGVYKTQEELDAHKDRTVMFAFNRKERFLGDTRWVDRNGDNIIDSKDMVVLGRTQPDFTGGISTNLRYKDFSLYIKGDFAVGHKLYNGRRIKGIAQTQGNQNGPVEILDTWSKDNANSNIARYDFTDPQKNHLAAGGDQGARMGSSSYFLEKGDFFALREMTLSYDLKKPLFGGFVKGARFYATGANLFYLTGFSGTTPEVSYGGNDVGRYPLAKTFTLGLNLTF